MSRKILTIFSVGILFLTACAPAVETGGPDIPKSSDDADQGTPPVEDWAPQPGDADLTRAEVDVKKTDLLTLESFPPQFVLHIEGWKGNPCQQLRVVVSEPDDQNRIDVEVYTVLESDVVCIQVLEGLDINIPLGSFASGEYTVRLNGEEVGTISAP
jgi:hypothetical protein